MTILKIICIVDVLDDDDEYSSIVKVRFDNNNKVDDDDENGQMSNNRKCKHTHYMHVYMRDMILVFTCIYSA